MANVLVDSSRIGNVGSGIVGQVKEPPPVYRCWLWHVEECPEGRIFEGREEADKALAAGWIDIPPHRVAKDPPSPSVVPSPDEDGGSPWASGKPPSGGSAE